MIDKVHARLAVTSMAVSCGCLIEVLTRWSASAARVVLAPNSDSDLVAARSCAGAGNERPAGEPRSTMNCCRAVSYPLKRNAANGSR